MDLYGNIEKAIAGMKYGIDTPSESLAAGEKLYPGDPVFGMAGDEKMGYGARMSAVSLTAGADLAAGNAIAVTINGITLPPEPFENSSADTVKRIINAIDQSDEIRALGIDAFFLENTPKGNHPAGPRRFHYRERRGNRRRKPGGIYIRRLYFHAFYGSCPV
jgi:hypothetical protein